MKRITNSPLFKEAMAQAQEITAELQNDPEKMAAFMQDLQVGGGLGALCVWGVGNGRGIDGALLVVVHTHIHTQKNGRLTFLTCIHTYTHKMQKEMAGFASAGGRKAGRVEL